jgi:hypothetical protein
MRDDKSAPLTFPFLPPNNRSPDGTIPEVGAYRRESRRQIYRKIEKGIYQSHKNGDTRSITWESVVADRERCLAQGVQLSQPPATKKRKPGRPRKAESQPAEPGPPRKRQPELTLAE